MRDKRKIQDLERAAADRGALALITAVVGAISTSVGAEEWATAIDGRAHPGGAYLTCAALYRSRKELLRRADLERLGL